MRKAFIVVLLLLAPVLSAKFKPWYWYFNSAYGTRALSLGKAFTAVADDGTALFWNPAALSRMSDMQLYFSYRTDLQELSESEELSVDNILYNHSYKLKSRLNQIDFFSFTFPFHQGNFRYAAGFGFYRWLPTGFLGSSQGAVYLDETNELIEVHHLDFRGSDGYDVLALSGSVDWKEIVSFGFALQNFFNTSLLRYEYKDGNDTVIEELSGKLGSRNWVFGIMVTPAPFLTIAGSFQTSISKESQTAVSERVYDSNGALVREEQQDIATGIFLPSRLALGIRLRPFAGLMIAYEYSRHEWKPGTLKGNDPYFGEFLFSKSVKTLQDPENHRLGIEYSFPYKRTEVAIRGGCFRERALFTDVVGKPVFISGFTLGLGVRFLQDFTLEAAFMKPWGEWPEWGYLRPSMTTRSLFQQDTFSLAVTYRFRRLFSR